MREKDELRKEFLTRLTVKFLRDSLIFPAFCTMVVPEAACGQLTAANSVPKSRGEWAHGRNHRTAYICRDHHNGRSRIASDLRQACKEEKA